MPIVYIAPTAQGTGDGSSEANAYGISSIGTAKNTATSNATASGEILFLDGTYNYAGSATWLDFSPSVANFGNIRLKSINKHGAVINSTHATDQQTINVNPNIYNPPAGSTYTTEIIDFKIVNMGFFINPATTTITGVKQIVSGVNGNGNGIFRGSFTTTLNRCEFYFAPSQSSPTLFNRANNTTFNNCTIYADLSSATSTANVGGIPEIYNNCIIASNNNSAFSSDLFGVSGMTNCCVHDVYATSGGTNNIFADPQLVDVSSSNVDLRLRPSSPCINTGILV